MVTDEDLDLVETERLLRALERRYEWMISVRLDFNGALYLHHANIHVRPALELVMEVLDEGGWTDSSGTEVE